MIVSEPMSRPSQLRMMAIARAQEPAGASLSDEELFEGFLRGSDEAFVELHRRLHPRMLIYAERMIGSRDAAEDVAQTVWERVIGMRLKPPAVTSPVGLIMTISRNLCLDVLKSPRRRQVPLELVQELHRNEERGDMIEIVEEELQRMPVDGREVLVMNLYMGYRFDEIAALLGRSSDAIWARASRARTELRRRVAARLQQEQRFDRGVESTRGGGE